MWTSRYETLCLYKSFDGTVSYNTYCLPVFRKIHTESAKVWMDKLGNVPLLVCLTFADKLYAEHMTKDGKHPDKEFIKFEIEAERSVS